MSDPSRMHRDSGLEAFASLEHLDDALLAGPVPTWWRMLSDWLAAAAASGAVGEANAMQLATVDAEGRPGVRTVLAKAIDERGVVFYTNLRSAKGRALAAHPLAEAVFAWVPLQRQVRLRGPVAAVDRAETLAYWRTRPRGSQLGAWASPQSEPVSGRAELEARYAEHERRFAGREIPVPPGWGGLRLAPEAVEFWQGRPDRLHDRLLLAKSRTAASGASAADWAASRLAP